MVFLVGISPIPVVRRVSAVAPTQIWTLRTNYFPNTATYAGNEMGSCIAMSEDGLFMVAGARWQKTANMMAEGMFYFYSRSGDIWTEREQWRAATPTNVSRFGWACDMDATGNKIVVSQPQITGKVEVYSRTNNT